LYWNAAAALYAYEYGVLSQMGLDVVGMSQLVGYPSLNVTRTDTGQTMLLEPQYPSVAMLNWTDGSGTARYWVLKLIIDTIKPGEDTVINTTTTFPLPAPLPSTNPFCGSVPEGSVLNLQCADPGSVVTSIDFASYGKLPSGSCGNFTANPTCNSNVSVPIVTQQCLGQSFCSVAAINSAFSDPCQGPRKSLTVQAMCSGPSGGSSPATVTSPVFAQAYLGDDATKKLLLVNRRSTMQVVEMAVGEWALGVVWIIDEATGFGPARKGMVPASGLLELAPFSVAVVFAAF
jgi:hypothetical protein